MGEHETTLSGAAIQSTIKQVSMIGDIGKEILEEFGVTKIDIDKEYSYKLRGAIHEAVRERFGKEALFFCGMHILDGYSEIAPQTGLNNVHKFLNKNSSRLDSPNIRIARKARNEFLKTYQKFVDINTKVSIFTPEKNLVGAKLRVLALEKIEFTLTNAVLLDNEYFNRGIILDALAPLKRNWEIKIRFIKSKSIIDNTGWTKFVWNLSFKRKITKKLVSQIILEQRQKAKDNFMQNVLKDSNHLKKQAELLTQQLSKFIPPQIHNAMMQGNYNTDIATKRKKLTVFFSDIKNFTKTSEFLQPEDLTKYLNEYFSEMTNIALDHGATIDKYIGDALMLFFGDPISKGEKEDARSCVEMALKMQDKMKELQNKWMDEGFSDPFRVRMGINTGYCNVGNFGSTQRLTYTIIGEEVNVAARLETLGKEDKILMSYETYAHVQDMVEVKLLKHKRMRGINKKIKIFLVLNRKKETDNNLNYKSEKEQFEKDNALLTLKINIKKSFPFILINKV